MFTTTINPNSQVTFVVDANAGILVFIDGNSTRVTFDDTRYTEVVNAINGNDTDKLSELLAPPTKKLETLFSTSDGAMSFVLDDGIVKDNEGYEVNPLLYDMFLAHAKAGLKVNSLLAFHRNLRNNPSYQARNEIPEWVSKANMPITEDGYILAYKRVRSNYTSIHDGKTRNDIGSSPKMNRREVDDNRNNTCSRGLHFCSKDYLPHFGSASSGDRVVLLKVNPADIVSIPNDYSYTKGRAWTYTILKDVTEDVKNDLWLNGHTNPVYNDDSDEQGGYDYYDDEDDTYEDEDGYIW